MASITPNSILELFADVELNENYTDSLYFASEAAKTDYFDNLTGKRIGRYTALSYQREERNFVRISANISTAIAATYMRFKNTDFENKWWYAFVTSVDYINNEVVQINYQIDVLMTWMGVFNLGQCYIERSHSASDLIGDNILPEPLVCDDYVMNEHDYLRPHGLDELSWIVILCYTFSGLQQAPAGTYREGIYCGLGMKAFNVTDISGINSFIAQFGATPENIISMYMAPACALGITVPTGGIEIPASSVSHNITIDISHITAGVDSLDNYIPKNNKLYCYPFNYCAVTNGQGSVITGKYEYGENNTISAKVQYSYMQPVTEMLRFIKYRRSGTQTDNYNSLSLAGYPMCNWLSDTFQAWLAQNAIPMIVDVSQATIAVATHPLTKADYAIEKVGEIVKELNYAAFRPDLVHGCATNGNLLYSGTQLFFSYCRFSVNYQIAEEIDHYFSLYGYAYNKVGVPNMHVRPHWTYVKTVDCKIHGLLPADDAAVIENIFNHGIRFWNSFAELCDYTLDNSPAAG